MKMFNLLHFHRRRMMVVSAFCFGYGSLCYNARNWKSDILRMGAAGSLANCTVECLFHVVDTVNIRAKASDSRQSTSSLVSKIWSKEGIYGFGKGFSACLYGSAACGFIYFSLYKAFKKYFTEVFGHSLDMAFCFMLASFTAELLTLSVQYPYDLIKCRLQSVNYIFKYQNLPHAFRKEIRNNGVKALYEGALPFLLTYTTFVAL